MSTRRNFIKNMTTSVFGVMAAPFIIKSTVLGRGYLPAANNRITLGHIGVGGRGSSLLRSFLQVDQAVSVAVCDPFLERREERAREIDAFYSKSSRGGYHGCKKYKYFTELLNDKDIDAVIVATPDHWHVPIGLAAAAAGKDMYIEKPLGISVAENFALRRAVKNYGNIFQYGTQQRSGRNFRFACELVRSGYIGDLETIHAWCTDISSQEKDFSAPGGSLEPIAVPAGFDYDLWLGPAPETPYTADRCTSFGTYHHYDNSLGFIAGWGAHPLDIAQWGNNTDDTAPVEYDGSGQIARTGLYKTVSNWDFMCYYQNGVKMRFMNEAAARPVVSEYHPDFRDHGTTFIGTEGWVSVDRYGIYARPDSLLSIRLKPNDVHLCNSDNHYAHFVQCVAGRRKTISPINSAVQSDIISHLCDISIRSGRKVKWDPLAEKILGDPAASKRLYRPFRSPWNLDFNFRTEVI